MWLFTIYGFYSTSVMAGSAKTCVRARLKKHLDNLKTRFPKELEKCGVVKTTGCDYLYRMMVPKAVWLEVVKELTTEQTWNNFKKEVAKFGGRDEYEESLHEVWETMFFLQQKCSRYLKKGMYNVLR